jgi:PKHD-type hydroxylase
VILPIAEVLSASDLAQVCELLFDAPTLDGRHSAGWAAAEVKRNSQFDLQDARVQQANKIISSLIKVNPLLQQAAMASKYTPILMSRYRVDQCYGLHVDDAWQQGIRTDLAYTLFLSSPEQYSGGELRIHDHAGTQDFKLVAGSLLLYPASTLHEVCEVKSGERLAAVGWIESRVRDHELRGALFDLDLVRRTLYQSGDFAGYSTLSRVFGVLARRAQ